MDALQMLPTTCLHDRLLLLGLPTFILACCVFALLARFRSAPANFPPGPPSFPVIGHLHLLGEAPHRSLQRLAKVYGPLMGLRFGSIPVIVASTPDMAAQILQTHDHVFAFRPRTALGKYCFFDYSSIAFDPHWRKLRQICATNLFSSTRLESFRLVREEERSTLLSSVFQDSQMGRDFTVRPKLLSMNNNIISRMVLGKTFAELPAGGQEYPSIFHEVLFLLGAFNIGDYIPYLHWMDFQGYVRRMKIVGKHSSAIFQEIVDARRRLRTEGPRTKDDFLDRLLCVSEDPQEEVQITDDNIKAVLQDMFLGGTDTSATVTEWALAELLRNPDIMKKAQEEIDSAVGNERFAQELDILRFPYLEAVVKETLRLHPIEPLLVYHESIQSCKIDGYDIPEKTQALVNVWAIGRDPSVWVRPCEFWPERFLEKHVDVEGQYFQLLPFGSGRRICPGRKLGLLSVKATLARLVHGFEWFSTPELDMSESSGAVTFMAKPLACKASPRLPHHLYCDVPI